MINKNYLNNRITYKDVGIFYIIFSLGGRFGVEGTPLSLNTLQLNNKKRFMAIRSPAAKEAGVGAGRVAVEALQRRLGSLPSNKAQQDQISENEGQIKSTTSLTAGYLNKLKEGAKETLPEKQYEDLNSFKGHPAVMKIDDKGNKKIIGNVTGDFKIQKDGQEVSTLPIGLGPKPKQEDVLVPYYYAPTREPILVDDSKMKIKDHPKQTEILNDSRYGKGGQTLAEIIDQEGDSHRILINESLNKRVETTEYDITNGTLQQVDTENDASFSDQNPFNS